jgi:hypothetical protein
VFQLAWEVPVVNRRIAAYCLTAKEHDDYPGDDLPPIRFEMTEREFVFNSFYGEPIDPNESFEFLVSLRYQDDPGERVGLASLPILGLLVVGRGLCCDPWAVITPFQVVSCFK